jgi:hypothetical protein
MRKTMLCVVLGLAIGLMLSYCAPVYAQTNPCQNSVTAGVLNPTKIVLESPDHLATEADGSFRITSYTAGMFLQGVEPGVGQPVQSQSIPRASFTLIPGTTPACYEAPLPFPSYPIGMTYVASTQAVGPGGTSTWAALTNPFGKPSPPAATGANRVR